MAQLLNEKDHSFLRVVFLCVQYFCPGYSSSIWLQWLWHSSNEDIYLAKNYRKFVAERNASIEFGVADRSCSCNDYADHYYGIRITNPTVFYYFYQMKPYFIHLGNVNQKGIFQNPGFELFVETSLH